MSIAVKGIGWLISVLFGLLAAFLLYLAVGTHSGATALTLLGPLMVFGGIVFLALVAITFNPLLNMRLRFLKTGFRQFLLGAVASLLVGLFSISAWASWAAGEDDLSKHDAAVAIGALTYAANLGQPGAMLDLALVYRHGQGVPEDDRRAFDWAKRAADRGLPDAATFVGNAYRTGEGVAKDPQAAVRWYRQAADAPEALHRDEAAYELALMYANGDGVGRDTGQAFHYYKLAADAGNQAAQLNLGVMLLNGDGVPKDKAGAAALFQAAAQSTNAEIRRMAENNLELAARN